MATHPSWPDLHDAILESCELQWSSGELILRIRTGDATHPRCTIVASAVHRLACDRQLPWGFSISINRMIGPVIEHDASVLEIEMQSGDVIRIEASTFDLRIAA
jgi:hypothetical protein